MRLKAEIMKPLRAALAQWAEIEMNAHTTWLGDMDAVLARRRSHGSRTLVRRMVSAARPHLAAFARRNDHLTAEQLEEVACQLSPGGAHTGATLARIVRQSVLFADPLLVAAVFRFNWHGGKAGFQFLPDPATADPDDYDGEAWELLETLDQGTGGDPRRILTGADIAFFDSLPDRFTIYRGVRGLTPERAAAGVCWTTRREVAEWFARRGGSDDAVVVTAQCRKADVRLAKADECEVVTIPSRAREIRCRPRRANWRPAMSWASDA